MSWSQCGLHELDTSSLLTEGKVQKLGKDLLVRVNTGGLQNGTAQGRPLTESTKAPYALSLDSQTKLLEIYPEDTLPTGNMYA